VAERPTPGSSRPSHPRLQAGLLMLGVVVLLVVLALASVFA
jgi:hypothetical protein